MIPLNPPKYYQVGGDVSPLLTAVGEIAVGNNNALVSAVSGKRIRIMGFVAQATAGTVGYLYLKSASGGSIIWTRTTYPASTNGDVLLIPVINSGYCETNTGEGLYIDVYTTAIGINLQYITYTPY